MESEFGSAGVGKVRVTCRMLSNAQEEPPAGPGPGSTAGVLRRGSTPVPGQATCNWQC